MSLYDVARQICHDEGLPWTDPRTGVTHQPPARQPSEIERRLRVEIERLRAELASAQAKADALDALEAWLAEDELRYVSYGQALDVSGWYCSLEEHSADLYTASQVAHANGDPLAAAITSALSQARGAAGAGEPA